MMVWMCYHTDISCLLIIDFPIFIFAVVMWQGGAGLREH
jgi:hypothetical protein